MSDSTARNTTGPVPGKATPTSGAYPVDETELSTQQERLRKAAVAGAQALKSPLSSVLSQKPLRASTTPGSQSAPKGLTQAATSTAAAPKLGDAPSQENPAAATPSRVQTHDNELILIELRKISAWADTQRKVTKWSLLFLAIFIPALVVVGFLMEQRFKGTVDAVAANSKPDWQDVERNVRSGDFDQAIAVGEELILKTPQYPEAHQRLARAYLAAGKLDKAKEHYAEAFRLFPSEENQKLLSAIELRSNAEKP